MSFDRFAPHYRWLEWVLAGRKLQRCRTAFLNSIPAPRSALLLGEGNGRFLTELLRVHPRAKVTCVDSSQGMLDCARQRTEQAGLKVDAVQFINADVLEWSPPAQEFDLIVSNFFLDCFRPEQLEQIVSRIGAAATADARWLVSDFCEPDAGCAKWRARLILKSMYLFFRCATRLPAARLTPPDEFLRREGFELRERRVFDWGLLHSDRWERSGTNSKLKM